LNTHLISLLSKVRTILFLASGQPQASKEKMPKMIKRIGQLTGKTIELIILKSRALSQLLALRGRCWSWEQENDIKQCKYDCSAAVA
jgi:hypothetical protein